MWPSGRRPLGNSDRRTNSGSVRSSSLESVKRVPLPRLLALVHTDSQGCGILPQFQRDVLVRSTAERVYRWPGTRLRDLGDDARGASGRRHDVGERVEWAGAFAVGRRWFSVVDVFSGRAVLGVTRERGLGLSDGGCSCRGRGLGEGRRGSSKRRRGVVLLGVARLVALLTGSVSRREVEGGEGRRVRRLAGGTQGCDGGRWTGAGDLRQRQRSDYG